MCLQELQSRNNSCVHCMGIGKPVLKCKMFTSLHCVAAEFDGIGHTGWNITLAVQEEDENEKVEEEGEKGQYEEEETEKVEEEEKEKVEEEQKEKVEEESIYISVRFF